MRRFIIISTFLVAVTITFGIVTIARGSEAPPPLTRENTPEFFTVSDPDGNVIVCANGKELRVASARILAAPTGAPNAGAPNPTEDQVYRCGTGRSPHLNARLIPISQDPLRRDG